MSILHLTVVLLIRDDVRILELQMTIALTWSVVGFGTSNPCLFPERSKSDVIIRSSLIPGLLPPYRVVFAYVCVPSADLPLCFGGKCLVANPHGSREGSSSLE